MKKHLITLSALGVVLAGCTASASASQIPAKMAIVKTNSDFMTVVRQQAQERRMDSVITQLKKRIGKTWYVFSGASPAGWDCSGLTMWAYQQLGIELPHSANKQARSGQQVKRPMVGDLVLFGYPGTNTFFHASIYIGNNKVIHAGFRRGQSTSILDLDSASVKNTKMRFVRVSVDG